MLIAWIFWLQDTNAMHWFPVFGCRKEALKHMFKVILLTALVNFLSSFVSGYLLKSVIDGQNFYHLSVKLYYMLTKNPIRTIALIKRLLIINILFITYALIATINSVLGTLSLFKK